MKKAIKKTKTLENAIPEVIEIKEIKIEKQEFKELTERDIAIEEARMFFKKIGNLRVTTTYDLNRIFNWYKIIANKPEFNDNINCSDCAMRVYNYLKLNI